MFVTLPRDIKEIMDRLEACGFEAFVVGGCVRDVLMGKTPADWDICTSALPAQIKECLRSCKTVDTGMKHGTVAAVTGRRLTEITTYRVDGEYSDNRHPDRVEFTCDIEKDLARRDFTINAMAYNDERGLIDPFGGQCDIEKGVIKCVGDPSKRFGEDALRILRGLRFAAVTGFDIEQRTSDAMSSKALNMKGVSAERINAELSKLIMGDAVDGVIADYSSIICKAVPGMKMCKVHTAPKNLPVRLALLFSHDTEETLKQLKYDKTTITLAGKMSRLFADVPPKTAPEIKRMLRDNGMEAVKLYFGTACADDNAKKTFENILDSNQCYSLSQLKINGSDIIAAGVEPGPDVGRRLDELLDMVIAGKVENKKKPLIDVAVKL